MALFLDVHARFTAVVHIRSYRARSVVELGVSRRLG